MATITATGQEKYHKFFTPFLEGFKYCEANNIEQLKSLVDDDPQTIVLQSRLKIRKSCGNKERLKEIW